MLLTLKLLGAKGGFLLIDEFENGLHYSVQEKVWQLVFELAEQLKVQVFATTHSWTASRALPRWPWHALKQMACCSAWAAAVRTSDQGRVIATVFDEAALQASPSKMWRCDERQKCSFG